MAYIDNSRRCGTRLDGVHELSVCQALLGQVAEIAKGRGASAVERIIIEVGPLSGVEPELLASAFAILRAGSCAAQAVLSIESTTVTISCLTCGAQSQTDPNRLVCARMRRIPHAHRRGR